jgi:hypothetical protein
VCMWCGVMNRRTTRSKPVRDHAVRINITIPPALLPEAERVFLQFKFTGWSDWAQARLRADAGLALPREDIHAAA